MSVIATDIFLLLSFVVCIFCMIYIYTQVSAYYKFLMRETRAIMGMPIEIEIVGDNVSECA